MPLQKQLGWNEIRVNGTSKTDSEFERSELCYFPKNTWIR